jgi:ATPase subunit of ABC transporter with duplicated ATPase domains
MDKLRSFLRSCDLDEQTESYLCAAFEEGSVQDLCDVAESFLTDESLTALKQLFPQDDKPATTEKCGKDLPINMTLGVVAAEMRNGKVVDEPEAVPATAAPKASKMERRQAKTKAKSKVKAKAQSGIQNDVAMDGVIGRDLGDVALFGLAETEEGLDAFDSYAVCFGKQGRLQVKNSENCKDIILPCIYIGIVTELGQKDLISCASLNIMRGHKYGLIGRNGCGKTTLLRRIARRQLPGLPNLKYGYVAQELVGTETSVLEAACSGDSEYQHLLRARTHIETALSAGSLDDNKVAELTESFATVMQRLDEVEEFFGKEGLKGHARSVLLGLQFTPEMLDMPTRSLSGGWRMRVALAQALLSRADCLLLDEPTNHLDFAGVLWLQHFLQNKLNPDCMLVIISHDKTFLDAVVTDIVEVRRQNIEQGSGNYSAWQQRKAQERETIISKVEANERERERTKEMIQKMRESAASGKKGKEADANKLRQAKQREVQLYGKIGNTGESKTYGRLELSTYNGQSVDIKALAAEKLGPEEAIKIKLPEPELLNGALLRLDGASFTIAEVSRTILRNVKISLEPQSRVAVVGSNGAGKTTLLRWLEGEQWPNSGAQRHPKLKVAHVSQHHLERLEDHLTETCVDWIRGVLPPLEPGHDPNTTLSKVAKDELLFGYLANFGLGGIAKQKLGTLSGGQKARLAFAGQVWHRPHLLLLDEPTNHLDMETLDALAVALKGFNGAVVIVSHNQGFLSDVCNELWTLDAGKVTCTGRNTEEFASQLFAFKRKILKKIKAF